MIYSSEKRTPAKEDRRDRNAAGVELGGAGTSSSNGWIFVLAAVVLVSAAAFFVVGGRLPAFGNTVGVERDSISELWTEGEFLEVLAVADSVLADRPLDAEALVYRGLAAFYHTSTDSDEEDREHYIDQSIHSLRRAQAIPGAPFAAETHFVLGLAYYERGELYADLAVYHLSRAVEAGISLAAAHEFLGLSYERLHDLDRSIEQLRIAADISPRDVTYLAIAEGYVANRQPQEALPHLDRVLRESNEPTIVHQARFLRGQIALDQGTYDEAEFQFRRVLEDDPNSADAHFYLGELYYEMGDAVAARAQWRNAVNLDSGHVQALRRLDS